MNDGKKPNDQQRQQNNNNAQRNAQAPVVKVSQHLPSKEEWSMYEMIATKGFRSGLLPSTIKNIEAAFIIALKGHELGIPPMMAFSGIHVVSGRPCMSAELMMAMIFKRAPDATIDYLQSDNEVAEVKASRRGGRSSLTVKFTMEDAKRAGLLSNPSWTKYPAAMLRARAVSAMARALFPDCVSGLGYTPEELGAVVDESGEVVIDITPPPPKGGAQKSDPKTQPGPENSTTPATFNQTPATPAPSGPRTQLAREHEAAIDAQFSPAPPDTNTDPFAPPSTGGAEAVGSGVVSSPSTNWNDPRVYAVAIGKDHVGKPLAQVPFRDITGALEFLAVKERKSPASMTNAEKEFVLNATQFLADIDVELPELREPGMEG